MDEPVSGLDVLVQEQILDLMVSAAARPRALLPVHQPRPRRRPPGLAPGVRHARREGRRERRPGRHLPAPRARSTPASSSPPSPASPSRRRSPAPGAPAGGGAARAARVAGRPADRRAIALVLSFAAMGVTSAAFPASLPATAARLGDSPARLLPGISVLFGGLLAGVLLVSAARPRTAPRLLGAAPSCRRRAAGPGRGRRTSPGSTWPAQSPASASGSPRPAAAPWPGGSRRSARPRPWPASTAPRRSAPRPARSSWPPPPPARFRWRSGCCCSCPWPAAAWLSDLAGPPRPAGRPRREGGLRYRPGPARPGTDPAQPGAKAASGGAADSGAAQPRAKAVAGHRAVPASRARRRSLASARGGRSVQPGPAGIRRRWPGCCPAGRCCSCSSGAETVFSGWSSVLPLEVLRLSPRAAALGTSAFWILMAAGRYLAAALLRRGVPPRRYLVLGLAAAAADLAIAAAIGSSAPGLALALAALATASAGPRLRADPRAGARPVDDHAVQRVTGVLGRRRLSRGQPDPPRRGARRRGGCPGAAPDAGPAAGLRRAGRPAGHVAGPERRDAGPA